MTIRRRRRRRRRDRSKVSCRPAEGSPARATAAAGGAARRRGRRGGQNKVPKVPRCLWCHGCGCQVRRVPGHRTRDAYEAGESDGPDDGDDFENGDEMSADVTGPTSADGRA